MAVSHTTRADVTHAGRVGELAVVAGLRLERLRRGRSGSRMAGAPSAGHGPWVVAVVHPACPRPGGPRPAPQEGGSRADGMAGWLRGTSFPERVLNYYWITARD